VTQTAVFRKVSLDRLASPEQLDQLLRVTDARGWIVLAAMAAVFLTAIAWGIGGSLPEDVSGTGILIKSGGVYEVIPSAGGRVTDVAVGVGDHVTEGQVVARVAQPELEEQLRSAQLTLTDLQTQQEHLAAYGSKDVTLQRIYFAQQRVTIEQSIASEQQNLHWLTEKIESQEKLVQDGLLPRPTLLNTRQQYSSAAQKISDDSSQLTQVSVRGLEMSNQHQADLRSGQIKIDEQRRQVAELQRELDAKSKVVAPYTGKVLEVMAERGSVVGEGEPILTLDLTGRAVTDLVVVLYVPSIHGKQIRPGMPIRIAPSTVKQEEYGLMMGRVTYVSDFPATSRGMQRVLKNERLVSELSGQDAPYEVHADLTVDPATMSRYKWTSSNGPPLRIQSGTLATANITVATKRPIAMVLPILREYTGI
jgi:HlyD family secretion protein